jgi:hypothetical protein
LDERAEAIVFACKVEGRKQKSKVSKSGKSEGPPSEFTLLPSF